MQSRALLLFLLLAACVAPAAAAPLTEDNAQAALQQARSALDAGMADPAAAEAARGMVRSATRLVVRKAIREGRVADALDVAKGLVARDPSNADTFVILGEANMAAKQHDAALLALERALEIFPASYGALWWKGRCLLEQGKPREAVLLFRRAVGMESTDPNAWSSLLEAHLAADQNREARELLPRYLQKFPNSPSAWNQLAYLHYCFADYPAATDAANKAIGGTQRPRLGLQLSPTAPVSVLAVTPGLPAAAEVMPKDLLVSVNGKPAQKDPGLLAATVFGLPAGSQITLVVERARRRKTIKLTSVLATDEGAQLTQADARAVRSLVLRAQGKLPPAQREADEALRVKPDACLAELAKALALLDLGKAAEALDVLDRNPRSGTQVTVRARPAHHRLARALALATLGRRDEAVESFRAARERGAYGPDLPPIWKDSAEARELLHADQALAEGRRLTAAKQFEAAHAALTEAIALAVTPEEQLAARRELFAWARRQTPRPALPEEARKFSLRSRVLRDTKDFEGARVELLKAAALAPWEPSLCFNAAMLCAGVKRYDEAVSHMQLYLAGAPDAPDVEQAKDLVIEWELLHEKAMGL